MRRQPFQLRILILPVVDGSDLLGGVLNALHLLLHLHEAPDEARLILQLRHGGLRPDNDVPDALPGDAVVLSDLRQ